METLIIILLIVSILFISVLTILVTMILVKREHALLLKHKIFLFHSEYCDLSKKDKARAYRYFSIK